MTSAQGNLQVGSRDLQLVSWNVKGLGSIVKRGKVFKHLKSLSADIIFLQETHINSSAQQRLKCNWISQIYQSPFTSHARGVAILFKKTIPFQVTSVTNDPLGRFIMVTGSMNSFPLTFLNVYGPNTDEPGFFRKVFDLLPDNNDSNIVIAGDFNCYLDPFLDRLSTRPPPDNASMRLLNNLLKTRNLVDIWRIQNPTSRDYSYYSRVHKSYSRIDYFLISSNLIPQITNSKYHNILISDHSPVTISLNVSLKKPTYSWRFNPNLLSDDSFIRTITTKLNDFIELNDNGEVFDSTLWETLKVVLRGDIISYTSALKKEREKRLVKINNSLPVLEKKYQNSKSPNDYTKIMKLKYEYNGIMSDQISNLLLKLRQKNFELGDKPGKLLARQLKGAQSSRAIYQIKSKAGTLITNPADINSQFSEFYRELYSSKHTVTKSDFDHFFETLTLPKLSDAAKKYLDSDFTLQEITTAIKSFPSNKAAGPDGFSAEFYKKFCDILAPLLLRMINESKCNAKLPKTLYEANISLILKKGKDETDPASFRPIALQNVDRKIIAKILAIRLNKHLISLIHPDQTGFIPGRLSFSNVRRLLNTIYTDYSDSKGASILSLDAHKAFDQVEWPYMFESLRRFGFGETFISWVKIIYTNPLCSVLTNGDRSAPFPLQRSVQQGCPLSPALFAIALEPLAVTIREHPHLRGLQVGGVETTISLYADDVILYLYNAEESVPHLLNLITSFGKLSGYTINWSKSEFMPLTKIYSQGFLESVPFKVVNDQITYLGLTIPKDPKLIFKLNFTEFISGLKQNIECWKLLPLSMVGRINSIKMISLPRFLYLCQNLPICLTSAFFKNLDSIILSYIWNGKNARISKIHLQKSKSEGGLGPPVLKHYYWAANVRALIFWQQDTLDNHTIPAPLWLKIESNSVCNSSLPAMLFSKFEKPESFKNLCYTLKQSVRILNQIRKFLTLPDTSVQTPICFNHRFAPPWHDKSYHDWREKGLISILDLYVDGKFASFNQLKEKYSLPQSHFFRYLQVRHYVQSEIKRDQNLPIEHEIYQILRSPPDSKHLISKIICLFDDCISVRTEKTRDTWKEELGIEISESMWTKCLSKINSCSVNSRHRLIQFKIVHRLHYSKSRLHKIYPSVSPVCDRCNVSESTLSHAFWSCPSLAGFWCKIFDFYSKAYKTPIKPDAGLAVLGCTQTTKTIPATMQQPLELGLIVAKKLILKEWKSPVAPSFRLWVTDMLSVIQMERLRHDSNDSKNTFTNYWKPFVDHLSSL
uniref:Reverse transcriptase domain-containing protein n=1 Tax=Amphiprion ocellaris TaxID=80972 RepID=A0AAQ5XLH4_AMPOC